MQKRLGPIEEANPFDRLYLTKRLVEDQAKGLRRHHAPRAGPSLAAIVVPDRARWAAEITHRKGVDVDKHAGVSHAGRKAQSRKTAR